MTSRVVPGSGASTHTAVSWNIWCVAGTLMTLSGISADMPACG